MTIKEILFEYINEKNGIVDYNEITQIILTKKPTSKWKTTHWIWYKTQITSQKGKYYSEFSREIIENILGSKIPKNYISLTRENTKKIIEDFFYFEDKSNEVEKDLAILLGKVSHHIHPKIIEYITKKNIEFKNDFTGFCHSNLNFNNFFYEGSDCIFPGVRRPVNIEKNNMKKWKNNINEIDGTIFNDNTYPRHLWTFLSLNKSYSGGPNGTWGKSGLNAFELAHIFGHKEDEKDLEKKVFKNFDSSIKPYTLFTSASNVVLIPKGLTKPTDKMDNIKICFYKRHLELYGNNLIGMNDFNNQFVPEWYTEIEWLEPILPTDWEHKIDNLLNYRIKHLRDKYRKPVANKVLR